jgi:hypothetical protein
MIDDKISFYNQEKLKFDELLNKLGWTEDYLLKEVCFLFSKKIFQLKNNEDFSKKHSFNVHLIEIIDFQ